MARTYELSEGAAVGEMGALGVFGVLGGLPGNVGDPPLVSVGGLKKPPPPPPPAPPPDSHKERRLQQCLSSGTQVTPPSVLCSRHVQGFPDACDRL